MENELLQIVELIGQFGFSVVFLYLFVREMNSHETTREYYRKDLRQMAGFRGEEFERERSGSETSPTPPAGLRERANGSG